MVLGGGGRFPSGGPNVHHSIDGKSRVPAPIPMPPQPNSKRPQEDMSAFNKLVRPKEAIFTKLNVLFPVKLECIVCAAVFEFFREKTQAL